MASGMTLLEAVNEIVETVGEFPMTGTAPTGTGTDIYHRARQFLDREDRRIQSMGWPENTILAEKHTASGGAISLAGGGQTEGDVLRVRSAGKSKHRNLVMRDDSGTQKLFDGNASTFTFGITEDVFLDTVTLLSFIDLPPLLQDVIVAKAKMEFQRRIQGNATIDNALNSEYITAELNLDRIRPDWQQPFNIQPMIAGGNQGGKQEKQGG